MERQPVSLLVELRRFLSRAGFVFLLIILTTASLAFWSFFRVQPEIGKAFEAREALDQAHQGMVDQETAFRGYLLTDNDTFLQPYRDGWVKTVKSMDEFKDLIGDDKKLNDWYVTVYTDQLRWHGAYAEPMIASARTSTIGDDLDNITD